MGIKEFVWAWTLQGLTPAERLTLLALADNTSGKRGVWPATDRIAAEAQLHAATVRRAKIVLMQRGLVTTEGATYTLNAAPVQTDKPDDNPVDGESLISSLDAIDQEKLHKFCTDHGLDLVVEAEHCMAWFRNKKRKIKMPGPTLWNWVKKSTEINNVKWGKGNETRTTGRSDVTNTETGRENYIEPRFTRGTR
jgi:hypothetical protein